MRTTETHPKMFGVSKGDWAFKGHPPVPAGVVFGYRLQKLWEDQSKQELPP